MTNLTSPSTELDSTQVQQISDSVNIRDAQSILTSSTELDSIRVQQISDSINIRDTQSILTFAQNTQKSVTDVAELVLAEVKIKDSGQAGELLSQMVSTLKGFQQDGATLRNKPSFFGKLMGKASTLHNFIQKFQTVSDKIDEISNHLELHKQKLLVDIQQLDKLYEATLDYYRELRYFIAGGEQKCQEIDASILSLSQAQTEKESNIETAQNLRDMQSRRTELDRRLSDLRLTAQVTMQALPSLRLVQENDTGLVQKITTTLVNTVPLWRQQLAQSIAIYRSGQAATALKASSDLTNKLLQENAQTLQQASRLSREQIERGVFDIETVEAANQTLIDTINEGLQIEKEASLKRQEIASRLVQTEQNLKQAILGRAQAK